MEKIDGIEIDIRSIERVSSARRWWPIVNISLPLLLVCLCMYMHVARANRVHIAHSYRVILATRFQSERERESKEKGGKDHDHEPWNFVVSQCTGYRVRRSMWITCIMLYIGILDFSHKNHFYTIGLAIIIIELMNYTKIACAFVSLSFLFLTCLFLQHSNGNSNGKFKATNFLGHGLQNWNACICDCADNGFRCMQRQTTTTGRYWRT